MSQVIVNPTEIRQFVIELKRLKAELESNQKRSSDKLRKLGETWKDSEHKKFEDKFSGFLGNIRPFIANIDEYCVFLERKAAAAENYLKQ